MKELFKLAPGLHRGPEGHHSLNPRFTDSYAAVIGGYSN